MKTMVRYWHFTGHCAHPLKFVGGKTAKNVPEALLLEVKFE